MFCQAMRRRRLEMKHRPILASAAFALTLAACATNPSGLGPTSSWPPRSEQAALANRMHPDIREPYLKDYIFVIVKGTSAAALEQNCRGFIRVSPQYRQSLQLVFRANDEVFGRGTSRKEVAEKVARERTTIDCASFAPRINNGGYSNLFLEQVR
jgi:hypothetical protein